MPWDAEATAGDLFVAVNGGTWEPVDGPSAPDGSYDLRVRLPDGRTVALEITQDTNPRIREQYAAQARFDWRFDTIDGWWEVSVVEPCDLRPLHADIASLIARLHAQGQTSLVIGARTPSSPIVGRLRELGVRLVHRVDDHEFGWVNVGTASVADTTAPSVVVDLIEDHASRPDNVRKLTAATDVDERHLLVWVTADRTAQMAALYGFRPDQQPQIPTAIDVVWVAAAFKPPTIVWCWRRGSGWQPPVVAPVPP